MLHPSRFLQLVSRMVLSLLCTASLLQGAPAEELQKWIDRTRQALQRGDLTQAATAADKAVALAPEASLAHLMRGQVHARVGEGAQAIESYTRALELAPDRKVLHQWRGSEYFKLGKIEKSIGDFDAYLAEHPDQDPYHWQRGISYYYAGEYAKGRAQFERHQTVNAHDVENAVWHFLCVAALEGPKKARAALIPIKGDSRVPMKEVHRLFAGQGEAEAVLKAAEAGEVSAEQRRRQRFYAHLYLGLYYEAMGEEERSREHIKRAAKLSTEDSYMGAVARVHAARLQGDGPGKQDPAEQ